MLDQYFQAPKNVPLRVNHCIHAVNMFENDSVIRCSTANPSVANNPKNIYLNTALLDKSTSTYYDDNNDSFEMLFQLYSSIPVKKIYHPSIVE